MVEPPKSGVQMVIFLTKIDFSISMISLNLHDLERTFISLRIIGKTCFFFKQKSGSVPEKIFATTRRRICNFYKNEWLMETTETFFIDSIAPSLGLAKMG